MEIKNPWSAKAEREDRTGQLVVGSDRKTVFDCYHEHFTESSFSVRYSKWDDDKVWSSQEWKSDTSMCDRTGQPVVTSWGKTHESQSSFFHEETQHDGTGQSVVNEEKLHDRTGQPVVYAKENQGHSNSSLETMKQNQNCQWNPDHSQNRVNDQVRKRQNDPRRMSQKTKKNIL